MSDGKLKAKFAKHVVDCYRSKLIESAAYWTLASASSTTESFGYFDAKALADDESY
jgi:hypothetical protein